MLQTDAYGSAKKNPLSSVLEPANAGRSRTANAAKQRGGKTEVTAVMHTKNATLEHVAASLAGPRNRKERHGGWTHLYGVAYGGVQS